MAVGLDDDDIRRALVRRWFDRYLLRNPSGPELAEHTTRIKAKGLDAALTVIIDSPEHKGVRDLQRKLLGMKPLT